MKELLFRLIRVDWKKILLLLLLLRRRRRLALIDLFYCQSFPELDSWKSWDSIEAKTHLEEV